MKNAEEYLENIIFEDKWPWVIEEEVKDIIKQAQLDVIEETCKFCSENTELELRNYKKNPIQVENLGQEISSEYDGYYYGVDANSILNCAEILKKQLE